jgi:GT2 family glycosyltransferase
MTNERFDLIVSIVHYNTPDLLRSCLDAFNKEGSPLRKKIIVVDNASSPALQASDFKNYPGLSLIHNARNVGFGSANNQVFRKWDGDWYLVTNPDVKPAPGSLGPLLKRAAARPRLGAMGVRLRYPDGRPQASCRRYPTLRSVLLRGLLPEEKAARFRSIQRYLMTETALEVPTSVDWMLGSCLLLREEALKQVHGFDEGFFMYYEDIDLCFRLKKAGWDVEYNPEFEWVHDYRRESTRNGRFKLRGIHFYSAMRFLAKHLPERGLYASL